MTEQDEITQSVVDKTSSFFEDVIHKVFAARREAFVLETMEKLRGASITVTQPSLPSLEEVWIEVESLSRLRSVVGGRFQNIRKKWLESGFPLREHRGDKQEDYELIQEGWVELSNWILKQGYEARLTPEKVGCVIELRKTSE